MKLMIVDDSLEIRKRVKEILKGFPYAYEVKEASSGAEAILMIPNYNPDIIIQDIQMPYGNGIEVLKFVKMHKSLKAKVIILTNYDEAQYKQRCLQLGADAYLLKTSAFDELYDVVLSIANKMCIEKS